MDWDELQPVKTPKAVTLGENLETLSLAELKHRVEALQSEIARVETELARKKAHEEAAALLFKK